MSHYVRVELAVLGGIITNRLEKLLSLSHLLMILETKSSPVNALLIHNTLCLNALAPLEKLCDNFSSRLH